MVFPSTHDVVSPVATVFGDERIVGYDLLADIARRWKVRRTATWVLDECYRMAWERQTEVGRSLIAHSAVFPVASRLWHPWNGALGSLNYVLLPHETVF